MVWTVRNGSGVNNLTHSDAWEYEPTWSPTGDMVAYCAGSAIAVEGADGEGRKKLIRRTDCLFGLSWSPDGSRIAFSKDGDIWSVRADGSGERRIRRSRGGEVSPSWSPDDRYIAYLRR